MRIASKPLMQTFKLNSDPDGQAEIVVRQATEGENIERGEMFSKSTRILEEAATGDVVKYEQAFNMRRIRRREAYLTLGSVTGIVDENGNELFKFAC